MFPTNPSSGPLFWTVLEIQADGESKSCIPLIFDSYDSAVAQFFQAGAAAARSSIGYHAIFILQSDGRLTDWRIFDRRV